MKKENKSSFIKHMKLQIPNSMEYYIPLQTDKDMDKFVKRVERIVRGSMEYRDYIRFLKDNIGLDSCIFFQNITSNKSNRKITIELHHEPLTLYDIVYIVVKKYKKTGLEINDLIIADEVLNLHYENKVGLIPLSKTAHQMIHNSTKLSIPINLCYGNYSEFLDEYDDWIDDNIYDKIERKIEQTKNLTPESFNAILKEFTYIDMSNVEDIEKIDTADANSERFSISEKSEVA